MFAMTMTATTPVMAACRGVRLSSKTSVERNGAKVSFAARANKRDVRCEGASSARRRRRAREATLDLKPG